MSVSAIDLADGEEWIIDAFGCRPEALRDAKTLQLVFDRVISELELKPLGATQIHSFPGHGGVTAMQLLTESHLTAHTFPERRYAALNLYCCRPRRSYPWAERLAEALGAVRVTVRKLGRPEGESP